MLHLYSTEPLYNKILKVYFKGIFITRLFVLGENLINNYQISSKIDMYTT